MGAITIVEVSASTVSGMNANDWAVLEPSPPFPHPQLLTSCPTSISTDFNIPGMGAITIVEVSASTVTAMNADNWAV